MVEMIAVSSTKEIVAKQEESYAMDSRQPKQNGPKSGDRGSKDDEELTPGEICANNLWAVGVACCFFVGLPLAIGVTMDVSLFRHVIDASAPCTNLTCTHNSILKPNANTTFCVDSVCTLVSDGRTCCEQRGSCTTLPCPSGFFPKLRYSTTRCRGATCDAETDLSTCCDAAATCPGGLISGCNGNDVESPEAVDRLCRQVWCEPEECCQTPPASCQAFECPDGWALSDSPSESCASSPCASEECCSATCAAVGCGQGMLEYYMLVANGSQRFCRDPQRCDSDEFSDESDVPNCCVGTCDTAWCSGDFEELPVEEAERIPCANLNCDDPSDERTCCREISYV